MKINWKRFNRTTHYWGSILCAIPIIIVIGTGSLLLLKKEFEWIQPASSRGQGKVPEISFDQVLTAAKTVTQAEITGWDDIDRLDVRPGKGIIKIRAKNRWEIQIDHQTMAILHVAFRRSDFIETIHDGTYFHEKAKLWLFLPCAIILMVLWITGMYLFLTTHFAKRRGKRNRRSRESQSS